ncbi:MAG: hypothetical protein IH991_02095 [Planctomycetes bacterium]|nr:hypothetical protein [Planctomycetota bacterium]
MIAIDQSRDGSEQVVYLSHDDGEGHGYIMGNSVEDFVDRYSLIGCLGYEDWQWLPFVADAVSGIDPHCSNAVSWRQWFKLNIDAG